MLFFRINIILDACLPGDIPLMISLLQKYALTSFDILSHLPRPLSSKILSYLSITELLRCEAVSHAWMDMCRDDLLWRGHCERLTRHDPVALKEPSEVGGWRILYRSLHSRWAVLKPCVFVQLAHWNATGRKIGRLVLHRSYGMASPCVWFRERLDLMLPRRFLKGHTGFCTTLLLKGRRLISGSYDETIRVWDIGELLNTPSFVMNLFIPDTGEQKKVLKVKAVSCLDFLDEQETFAVGFHDVG